MAAEGTVSKRMSAAERREAIIVEATRHFAKSGYTAASTDAIARDAGISQPYLFRLFGTKRELFLACHERMHERIAAAFRRAAEAAPPEHRLMAMGKAYTELLEDRDALLFQMQSHAACADPDIQGPVRARYADIIRLVRDLTGGSAADLWFFCSAGLLLNLIATLDLDALAGEEEWAARWADPGAVLEELRGAAGAEGC